MSISRRHAFGLIGGLMGAAPLALREVYGLTPGQDNLPPEIMADHEMPEPIADGPFKGTKESLEAYQVPDWFRDAKFGIWAHWGPQSAAEAGDWYARNMYIQSEPQYKSHVARYGHPSKFGFKDVIGTFKGDQFDADYLIGLYKKAGAKYFVSMGVHHDNFDMWNSKHQPWNVAKMGPKKDVVGLFSKAARENGLRFGVSEHLWISYKWFSVNKWADQTGPLKGVSYDGVDPKYVALYESSDLRKLPPPPKLDWNDTDIPDSWKRHWYLRIKDLVDSYDPDLLYTDGAMPFESYGLHQVANLYNRSAARHGGRVEAIYNSKRKEDCTNGTCVLDVERGVVDKIWPTAWQTDTCVGDWHYKRGVKYKTPKTVVDMLVDIVSRNGNLLLNFPLPNSGMIDDQEKLIVEGITKWLSVNSEGIYGSRPWKMYGEGPSTVPSDSTAFNESKRKDMTMQDVRFTTKNNKIYAFVMGAPQGQVLVKSLSQKNAGKIENVELVGHDGKLHWSQDAAGLRVDLPAQNQSVYAVSLRVTSA